MRCREESRAQRRSALCSPSNPDTPGTRGAPSVHRPEQTQPSTHGGDRLSRSPAAGCLGFSPS